MLMPRDDPEGLRASLLKQPVATADEPARVDALHGMRVLDSGPDARFDRIVRLAALLFGCTRAAVILIDEHRLWLKASVGVEGEEHPRQGALVETVLAAQGPVFAGDVRQDGRFANADAASGKDTRFYASAPLTTPQGQIVGALSIGDEQPRDPPTADQRAALIDLANLAMEELVRDAQAAAARDQHAFDQQRFELALTAADLAAFDWDLTSDTVLLSERVGQMVGWDGGDVPGDQGEAMLALVHPDDREAARAAVSEGLRTRGRYQIEHRMIRPGDGGVIWVASSGVLTTAPAGGARRVIGVMQDITARKLAEEQRETLVAELDHRVKNVLATVQSLAAQSARKAASLEGFLKTFAGRLKSMASAHQLLTATRWRGASLQNIAAAELGGLAPGQTRWEGPDILLTPRAANAMSLALHELATNAVKFGALSTDAGRVEVRWCVIEGGGLKLQWAETGGPAVTPPTRRGFGTTLLEKVTGRELGGGVQVEHRREGVTATLTAAPSAIADCPPPASGPASPAPAQTLAGASAGAPYAAQPIRVEGLKLLIVEDALLLALELEAGLTEAGAEIIGSAADVDEAMRMIDLTMDAAVLDANLNGASVGPVAAALAARGVPFVFATGYGDNTFVPQGYDAPIIRKPYDVTQVAAALTEVTHRA
jgi:PAS domain S-box-containing protein